MSSGRMLRAALLVGAGLSLVGCDSIRDAVGTSKEPPDEFAVATKAPLIIPPDFNLRPPRPGAAPENQVEPTQAAEQTLYGADTAAVAASMPGNMSQGEKMLLASAGAQNADPNIRQSLASDRNRAIQASSDDFTNSVLFWQKPSVPSDPAVNADAEAKRLATQNGTKTTGPERASSDSAEKPQDTNQTDSDKDKKKSGGWFDWF